MAIESLYIIGPLVILLFFVVLAFAIFLVVAWIWMIIDCIQRKFSSESDKIVWILVLILIPLIGLILYYFIVFKKNKRKR